MITDDERDLIERVLDQVDPASDCAIGNDEIGLVREIIDRIGKPIPMILFCPMCQTRHIDVGDFATKPHKIHACQGCGFEWKPAQVPTVGVDFLPNSKNNHELG